MALVAELPPVVEDVEVGFAGFGSVEAAVVLVDVEGVGVASAEGP